MCCASVTRCIITLYVSRVMLLVVLCLVAMVENQSSQHISKIWQHHHTRVMISNNRTNWAPVSGNCDNLLSVHKTRVTLHFVRDSMRRSGNANLQMVREVYKLALFSSYLLGPSLNSFSTVLQFKNRTEHNF